MIDPTNLTAKQKNQLLKKIDIADTESCWNWNGKQFNSKGEGVCVLYHTHTRVNVPRLMYQLFVSADLRTNTIIKHTCGNPRCCNPTHLEACDALEEHITQRIDLDPQTECWVWKGGAGNVYGHGAITFANATDYIHRFMYREFYGPIPDGLVVRHKCRNPRCCNPEHLELGTQADNMRDRQRDGTVPRNTKRLSPSDVMEIHTLYHQKVSPQKIAKQFETTTDNIHKIAAGRTWGKVYDEFHKNHITKDAA